MRTELWCCSYALFYYSMSETSKESKQTWLELIRCQIIREMVSTKFICELTDENINPQNTRIFLIISLSVKSI
jgi:hypothetical protein